MHKQSEALPKKEEGKKNQEEYYRDIAPPRRFRIQNQ
jgi:hypothetical protein